MTRASIASSDPAYPFERGTTMYTCRKRYDVAALLLGALTPAEEADTLTHIAGCAPCRQVLAEFTALPELLAKVPLSMLELIERSKRPDVSHAASSAAGAR